MYSQQSDILFMRMKETKKLKVNVFFFRLEKPILSLSQCLTRHKICKYKPSKGKSKWFYNVVIKF